LTKWFWAAYLASTQTPGISGTVLSRQIGVSYETAYMMLQKLRVAMVEPQRGQLSGTIEVDEAFVSAGRMRDEDVRRRGRGTAKPLVAAAVEVSKRKIGQVRLRHIKSGSAAHLMPFIEEYVEEGSVVITDAWAGYRSLAKRGFDHVVVEAEDEEQAAEKIPHVHTIFSNLKAWLIETHHGVSSKHLQAYLNEFAFRYNTRKDPQGAFLAVLQVGMRVEGPRYEQLYGVGEKGGWVHQNPEGESDDD